MGNVSSKSSDQLVEKNSEQYIHSVLTTPTYFYWYNKSGH